MAQDALLLFLAEAVVFFQQCRASSPTVSYLCKSELHKLCDEVVGQLLLLSCECFKEGSHREGVLTQEFRKLASYYISNKKKMIMICRMQ